MAVSTTFSSRIAGLLVGSTLALSSLSAGAASIIGVEFLGAGDRGVNANPNAWTMTGFGFTANRVFWELSGHGTPVAAGAFDPSILFASFRITTIGSIEGVLATGCFEAFNGPCGGFGNDPFDTSATVGAGIEFNGRFGDQPNDFDPSDAGDIGVSANTLDINPFTYEIRLEKFFGREGNGSSGTVNVNAEVCFEFTPGSCVGLRSNTLPLSTDATQGITNAPAPVSDGGEFAFAIGLSAFALSRRGRWFA